MATACVLEPTPPQTRAVMPHLPGAPSTETAVESLVADLSHLLAQVGRLPMEEPGLLLEEHLDRLDAVSRHLAPGRRRWWMERVVRIVEREIARYPAVRRIRETARGCAGDPAAMEALDRGTTADIGVALSRYCHALPAVQAARNRRSFFVALLGEAMGPLGDGVRLLGVGGHPAREVREGLLVHTPDPETTSITLIDRHPAALAGAQRRLGPLLARGYPTTLVCHDAKSWRPRESYDLIWAAGLLDRLEDRAAAPLLQRLWHALAPAGWLAMSGFHPCNPTRPIMEWLGGWFVIHRSEEALLSLAGAAGIPEAACEIRREPLGIHRFLVVRR